MVSITKRPSKGIGGNAALPKVRNKKAISYAALLIPLLLGLYCLSWFAVVVISTRDANEPFELRGDHLRLRIIQQKQQQQKIRYKEKKQQYLQQAKLILMQLDQLNDSIPLSPASSQSRRQEMDGKQQENQKQHQKLSNSTNTKDKSTKNMESQFLVAVRKECIPGRDDSSGEINPTTHRQRECLRHVPTINQNKNDKSYKSKVDTKLAKPRIGLMFPPGYIGQSFAHWIANALEQSSSSNTSSSLHPTTNLTVDVDFLPTSHVPVYGYGKSHGYTKIIRFVTLPLSLAAYDAYLRESMSIAAMSSTSSLSSLSSSLLDFSSFRDELERMNSGINKDISSQITTEIMGSILQLITRWHCRLSHVSAHTAMLTLSLDDVLKGPATALSNILSFIWREDWEWEDDGNHRHDPQNASFGNSSSIDWKAEADDLVVNHGEKMQSFLDMTSFILNETISLVNHNANVNKLRQSIQEAFASELVRSAGMTVWPCPSFWEGIEEVKSVNIKPSRSKTNDVHGDDNGQMQVLRRIAEDMVPNCSDDDPFVRCTVNKDRCEVKGSVKCN